MLVFYLAALDSDDDKNKFEYIYRKYYRFMLHTAAGIIKNPTLAEDAVHETFVQLLRGIDTLRIDNERALKSYLYMVTRERSIDSCASGSATAVPSPITKAWPPRWTTTRNRRKWP